MSTAVAALLLITAAILGNTEAFSEDAIDCCFATSDNYVPRKIAASYIVQTTHSGCPIAATVFITKRNKRLCAPPAEDKKSKWVANLISFLDNKAGRNEGMQTLSTDIQTL
ncbi:C-C motif chemokine 19a.2 [Salminus brasiliensis]|uniref:C-C motif chemokine 19a.2 n=1 Tax=Salminus brasiliensis TaxID=930266 RepID=UPI003B832EE7